MTKIARVLVALILAAIAVFTLFGFLATFEPPGFLLWRLVYAVGGFTAIGGAGWVLFRKPPSA